MSVKGVTVPVTAEFEKRLAELAWENCSELARSTVAGKLAMGVDCESEGVRDLVVEGALSQAVGIMVPGLLKRMEERAPEMMSELAEQLQSEAVRNLPRIVREYWVKKFESKMRDRIDKEVSRAVEDVVGANQQSLLEAVRFRVDAVVRETLGRRLANNPAVDRVIHEQFELQQAARRMEEDKKEE